MKRLYLKRRTQETSIFKEASYEAFIFEEALINSRRFK